MALLQATADLEAALLRDDLYLFGESMTKSNDAANPNDEKPKEALLTNAFGMGGSVGGEGFAVQDRYIACRAIRWAHEPGVSGLWVEGMGDVDVLYENLPEPYGEHVQVKDFTVTRGKFKEIVEGFVLWDDRRKGFYRKYIVACPGLNSEMETLRRELERMRCVPRSLVQADAVEGEKKALNDRLTAMGLDDYADFIKEKVHFDIDASVFGDDDLCCRHFAVLLLEYPKFAQRVVASARAAYVPLLRAVQNSKQKVISVADITSILDVVLRADTALEPAAPLVIHNWTNEAHDAGEEAIVLDWSQRFDRQQRRVPSASEWNNVLLPELLAVKKKLQEKPQPRLIRFRGFCTLSTGMMVGAVFPQVNGWTIEVRQPPGLWRTDAPARSDYQLQTRELGNEDGFHTTPDCDNLLLVVAVTQPSAANVARWLSKTPDAPQFAAALEVQPYGGSGSNSIHGTSDAASFALAVREFLKKQNAQRGTCRVHLFYNGPFALSVMLGHSLTSVGRLHLYEWQEPGFSPSVSIAT